MDAGGSERSEIEVASAGDDEFVAIHVVVAEHILAAAHVAEVEQDVLGPDWPEVRARSVVAHQAPMIVLEERVQVFPSFEVFRAMQKHGSHPFAARDALDSAAAVALSGLPQEVYRGTLETREDFVSCAGPQGTRAAPANRIPTATLAA